MRLGVEQKETGSEGELSKDVRPAILGWFGRLGHDPELAAGVMNDRHRLAGGGAAGPALTEEVHLLRAGPDAAPDAVPDVVTVPQATTTPPPTIQNISPSSPRMTLIPACCAQ